jgi:hypothetical protein
MDHPKIVLATIKEGGNASSRQLTRQQIGIQTQKLYKVQAQKILRQLGGWSTNLTTQLNRIVGLHLLQPLHLVHMTH